MDIWLPRYGFPMFLHSDQGKEFENAMIHKLSELLGTAKTKTTPYHPRSDGLVERFNRILLAMLAMFVSREHDNWDDLLPFMMLAYNTTVHTTTGFTPYILVFGEECNLPGNLVHRELRPDPPPGDPGTYATWVQQALYESYDEVRAQQERAMHRQKRNYDSKAVACAFPMGCWTLRYYPPARNNKLCSPWIGPYKIVRAPMEWVVGIQTDADARIFYVHMDDIKRCATPDPEPILGTWRAPPKPTPGVGTRSRTRQAEIEQVENEQALAARAEWPPSPDTTKEIQRGFRELRLRDVLRDAQKELQQIAPDLPELDENQNLPKPPAAGLMTQHQDIFFIPPPRVVGGARGISAPVSTATLGLIHRQDPSLAALLREDPGSLMSQSTRRQVYSTMRLIRTGMLGQLASLQQWEEAMHHRQDDA